MQAELAPELADVLLERRVRQPAVVLGRPAVQRAEVDAVQDGDAILIIAAL